jgi:hypothetical protein
MNMISKLFVRFMAQREREREGEKELYEEDKQN